MTEPHPERLQRALSGRYRIAREIGAGGMATVYLARDERHDRNVAIKVLKPELAAVIGAERFLTEIRTTANLQHPHVLPLFDSGEADGLLYYVMPYVEGESLRERLRREKQLPVDEAVRIARDVAEALEHAHAQGVIHRDIKPANILLSGGRPLVSDFGIALAISNAGGGRLTETGLSLGTPHYMSPEQATADTDPGPRSDVYALGCVLYEMLIGSPPFTGSTAQAVLGKIITSEAPRASAERASVPLHVEQAIVKALEKLPADRPTSAARFAEMLDRPADSKRAPERERAALEVRRGVERIAWAAAVAVAFAGAYVWAMSRAGEDTAEVVRLSLELPESTPLALMTDARLAGGFKAFSVSDDGSMLVFVGMREGVPRLFVRRLDSFEATELPGTEGAWDPFFSPNGAWVGFFVGNQLFKVRVDGGDRILLAETPNAMGADWGPDRTIVASITEAAELILIPEDGGTVREVGVEGDGHAAPQFLPDGRILLSQWTEPSWILDPASGEATRLGVFGGETRYVPAGYLLTTDRGTVYATRFSLETSALSGPTVPVLSGVRQEVVGAGQWHVTHDGTLLYAAGIDLREGPLTWVDSSGSRERLGLPVRTRASFTLSPDGRSLAVGEQLGALESYIWVYDLTTGQPQRLTLGGREYAPVSWSPDGTEVLFNRGQFLEREDPLPPAIQRVGATPAPRDVASKAGWSAAHSWSASGHIGLQTETGIEALDAVSGEVTRVPTPDNTAWGVVVSPDGDLVAYTSQHTGEYHVFVEPFPPTGEDVVQVSLRGGSEEPLWSRDGERLYYRNGLRIMAATVTKAPELSLGDREVVFEGSFANVDFRSYEVSPDGSRVLIVDAGDQTATSLRVVQNWLAEVEARIAESERSGERN